MKKKLVAGLAVGVMTLAGFTCQSALAESTQSRSESSLKISAVYVDTAAWAVYISSDNLDKVDKDDLIVTLGDFGELIVNEITNDGIVAAIPVEYDLVAGDFMLTVAERKNKKDDDKHKKSEKSTSTILAQYNLTIGAVGPQGDKGDQGIQGIQGIQGEKGDKGDQGIQGIQGVKGDKGDQGIQGVQGVKGDKGDQGIQGVQGVKGDKGDQGIQGIQGVKGDKGDQGIQGVQGTQGLQGPQGDQAMSFPASLVTDRAQGGSNSISNISLNGHTITGTCTPGGNVTLNFNWNHTQGANSWIHQVNVGFVGGDTRCLASTSSSQSGSASLTLTCPTTPGPHQLGVSDSLCYGCTNCNSGEYHAPPGASTPGYGVSAAGDAFIGVVTVK